MLINSPESPKIILQTDSSVWKLYTRICIITLCSHCHWFKISPNCDKTSPSVVGCSELTRLETKLGADTSSETGLRAGLVIYDGE